ncbi:hypothetical protein ACFLZ5_01300 [Thermodesulfobacteriota bacterium]
MKLLPSALILPETEPAIHDIAKLLFFFNSLSYYLPTETDTENLIGENLFKNLCTGYAPAPLHDDLSRFNRLVRDMENSRPDNLVRLFSSAQSPIATGQIRDRDEASAASIASALQKDNDKITHARYRERLWQARLVLKLAEILDRRESEVTQGMARISTNEQKIFNSLEGLNGTKSANSVLSPDLEKFSPPEEKIEYPTGYSSTGSSMLIPIRVKAWAELFLADPSRNRPFILVTPNPENGNIILDRYENAWGSLPQKLFSLSIPTVPGPGFSDSVDEHYISSRMKLLLAAEENLKFFENFLRETALSHTTSFARDKDMRMLAEHVAAWEKLIKKDFPDPATVNRKLVFYSFPGVTTESLLQRIFQLESTASATDQGYVTSILTILHA